MSLPLNRSHVAVKKRADSFLQGKGKQSDGEGTTFDTTYTNVRPTPWAALPIVTADNKARILGGDAGKLTAPSLKAYDSTHGQPLFWAERKPVELLMELIEAVDGKMIVDLSPGSGTLARACMVLGVKYLAICRRTPFVVHVRAHACCLFGTGAVPLVRSDRKLRGRR